MNRVLLILDPIYGERLLNILSESPTWIISSPRNKPFISEYWKQHPASSHFTGVTSFEGGDSSLAEQFIDIFDTIIEHHPSLSTLDVIGLTAMPEIASFLIQMGFSIADSSDAAFTAIQNTVEQDAAANP
jgi:hypothetical protein